MPIIGNDYQQPSNAPTGLSLPGQGPYVPPAPQRELTLGQMAGVGLQGVGAALQIPRLMAWNAGPALVGRAGEGPQTGHDLLSRLGANPDNRWTHGFGAGLEMVADPLMLGGMGGAAASRGVAGDAAGSLLNRLQRHAGSGLGEASQAAAQRAARPIAAQPGSVTAQQMRAMGADAPALTGSANPVFPDFAGSMLPGVHAPGVSPPFLRNMPSSGGYPNFPAQLESQQYLQGAGSAGGSRLDRMIPGNGNATMARRLEQEFNVQPLNTPVGPAAPPPMQSTPTPALQRPPSGHAGPALPGSPRPVPISAGEQAEYSDAIANALRARAATTPSLDRGRTLADLLPSAPGSAPTPQFPWAEGFRGAFDPGEVAAMFHLVRPPGRTVPPGGTLPLMDY